MYSQLRAAARRILRRNRRGPLDQTTMLANEAWLRISPDALAEETAAAAGAVLRSVFIDSVRRESALKRGGGWVRRVDADSVAAPGVGGVDLTELEHAIQLLHTTHPRAARVIELRFFAGLDVSGTARLLGVSERTVVNDYRLGRALLRERLDRA